MADLATTLKSLTDEKLQQEYQDAKGTVLEGVYESEIDRRASPEPSGGDFYSAAAATLDDPELTSDIFKWSNYYDKDVDFSPGTHMNEWEKFIYPNSPSTDMYHQMATYNMLNKKLPENKWLRKLASLAAVPAVGLGSLVYDPVQAGLTYNEGGEDRESFMSHLADQNPFPQAWSRMKGASELVADEFGFSGSDDFNEAYNQTVEIPRNIERTAGRVDPSGNVMAYGLNGGGIVKDNDDYYDYDPSTFTNLSMRGDSSTRYRGSEEDSWDTEFWTARNPDTNQAITESLVYQGPDMISNRFVEPSGQWKDYATGEGGQLKGPQTWMYDPPRGVAGTDLAQSQWKRPENMEKTIKSLELRPEFEGWTHDEIKYWIINQARANRGGIIGLL